MVLFIVNNQMDETGNIKLLFIFAELVMIKVIWLKRKEFDYG